MADIPSVEISPEELELEVDAKTEHQYLELYAPFMEEYMEVDLVEKESNESVWNFKVRRAELKLPASHSEPDVIPPPDLHFIECHRTELIQRVASVNQVLDMLVNVVIDAEQYDQISSKETSQKKMRELYDLVPKWNDRCKDVLYRALKETNRFLIADLEEKDNLRNLASLTL
uniref:CARD domain-containing protein n=1 Tax=Salvator merianae TaxID=96440 RepID=A0A8D0BHT6_SALMN